MADVFIAYHHQPMTPGRPEDRQADNVAQGLEAVGLDVWHDGKLIIGQEFAPAIRNELGNAKALVALWSTDAAQSRWFRAELDAYQRIHAGRIVHCIMNSSIQLPIEYSRDPTFDLSAWKSEPSSEWARLLNHLSAELGFFASAEFGLSTIYERVSARHPKLARITPKRLFISHATRADGRKAAELVAALEIEGHQCLIAPRDVTTGLSFSDWIRKSVMACDALLLLLSAAALESEYVKDEIHIAVSNKKRILPIRLQDVGNLDVLHVRLPRLHRVDWIDGNIEPTMQAVRSAFAPQLT